MSSTAPRKTGVRKSVRGVNVNVSVTYDDDNDNPGLDESMPRSVVRSALALPITRLVITTK